jgi:SAM-dependent methyltransferase
MTAGGKPGTRATRNVPRTGAAWKHHTRDHYDNLVPEYTRAFFDDLSDRAWLDGFRATLGKSPRVLDAGCGPGHFSRYLAGCGCDLVGIDISSKMITAARELVPEADFRVMDFTALDFEDKSFDGVLCAYALLHVPRAEAAAAIAEFRRILTDDGRLALMLKAGSGSHAFPSPIAEGQHCYVKLFRPDEMVAMLTGARFRVEHAATADPGAREIARTKLFFLALPDPL